MLGFVIWIARTVRPEPARSGRAGSLVGNPCRSLIKYPGGGFVRFHCRVFYRAACPRGRGYGVQGSLADGRQFNIQF